MNSLSTWVDSRELGWGGNRGKPHLGTATRYGGPVIEKKGKKNKKLGDIVGGEKNSLGNPGRLSLKGET